MDKNTYLQFKPIINLLKKFYYQDVLNFIIRILDKQWGMDILLINKNKYPMPWNLFTLIHWVCVYSDKINIRKPKMKSSDFLKLHKMMNERLVENTDLLKSENISGVFKFMRATFYAQQYYYHPINNLYYYLLQRIIYEDIGINYKQSNFHSITSLNIIDFMDLQFVMFAVAQRLKSNIFSPDDLKNHWPKSFSDLKIFLKFISFDQNSIIPICTVFHKNVDNPKFEKTLFTPLYKKPIISNQNQYKIINSSLLIWFLNYGVYDILKENDLNNFPREFGASFEKYLRYSLSFFPNWIDSREIKRITGEKNTSCDYAIIENDVTTLIEIKSSEMYSINIVNPELMYLKRSLKDSVIHGYKQIINTANCMKRKEYEEEHTFLGIIITFKPLFLGNPDTIWNELIKSVIIEENIEYNESIINFLNIFVMSIEDFEKLCILQNEQKIPLNKLLNEINTIKGFFQLNLHVDNMIDKLPHIDNKLNQIQSKIINYIKK